MGFENYSFIAFGVGPMDKKLGRGLLVAAGGISISFVLFTNFVVFAILFNNIDNYLYILAILLSINLALVFVATRSTQSVLSFMKIPALYCAVIFTTWAGIELLFPTIMPVQCTEVLNLSKAFLTSKQEPDPDTEIFLNTEVFGTDSGINRSGTSRRVAAWHRPGESYDYHGVDPNSGNRYINVVRWNSRGYYDHDRTTTKGPNTYRIVLVGDSFVESIQVPLRSTFHKLMESALNNSALISGMQNFEVIALGNSGSGQVRNLSVLQTEGLAFDPDLVIMTLCTNDFCDDDPVLSKDLAAASSIPSPLFRRLVGRGFLSTAFAVRQFQATQALPSPELLQWCESESKYVETAWERTLRAIRSSNDLSRLRGASFLLVYLGSDLEVQYSVDPKKTLHKLNSTGVCTQWDLDKSVNRVASFCRTNDIKFVSLLSQLADNQLEQGKVVFGDHYSPFGHQIASEALVRSVKNIIQTPDIVSPDMMANSGSIPSPTHTRAAYPGN